MILAFDCWKVEQLEWRYDLPLNKPYLEFWWYIFFFIFFKISSLAHMILRWHSWIAHVVFYSSLRPTIYKLMWSSGRENVGSPMLRILLSQKLVLVKVMTLHIPIIGKRIIKDGGEKWTQQKCDGIWWINHILCFWKNMDLSNLSLFFLSFFACKQAPPFFFTR